MEGNHKEQLIYTHDSFFKGAFSYPEVAAGYIRNYLPSELTTQLNLSGLELSNSSYVTNELRNYFSDLVWNCPTQSSEIQITFLFEHKSYPMKFPHLQLLKYMLQIWEIQLEDRKTKTLKPVIPIIFYHGLKAWKLNSFESYFGNITSELMPYIPAFQYILTDLARESTDKISNLETEKLVMTLLSFQQFRDTRRLMENMGMVLEKIESFELSQENENFVKMVLIYIFNYSKLNPKEMEELIKSSRSKSIRKSKSTAQQLIDQGIEKGIEKGIEQGIEQGIESSIINAYAKGKSIELLAEIFEKTSDDIELIISKYSRNNKR